MYVFTIYCFLIKFGDSIKNNLTVDSILYRQKVTIIWFPLWRAPGCLTNLNKVWSTNALFCDWLSCLPQAGEETKWSS